jgi:hypothetical protein
MSSDENGELPVERQLNHSQFAIKLTTKMCLGRKAEGGQSGGGRRK